MFSLFGLDFLEGQKYVHEIFILSAILILALFLISNFMFSCSDNTL